MVSLLYVHAKRAGWKIRLQPKSVILKMKTIQIKNKKKPCTAISTTEMVRSVQGDRLGGLVVKASPSRAEDPGSNPA